MDMCGRFALTTPPDVMRTVFGYADTPDFPPRYNIAPTQPVPVVVDVGRTRRFTLMRWGFIPGWVKEPKEFPLVINIRSETVREKPAFRAAFLRRRGLMPADGFYEWHKVGRTSQPYLLRRPDGGVFAFAALWETFASADGSEIDTCALLNTDANALLSAIHPRAPVILPVEAWATWLDPLTPPDVAHRLLVPPPDDLLEMFAIGPAINKVANDDASVQLRANMAPADVAEPAPRRRRKVDDGQGSLF